MLLTKGDFCFGCGAANAAGLHMHFDADAPPGTACARAFIDKRFQGWQGIAHGGILATLIDLGADWAMVRKTGRGVPTIDMRVDYHAVAMPGDLTIKGKIVRMGGQFSTAEAQVFDAQGKLLASGRGTYFTAPPKS